jgi:hypothetical protein
MSPLKKLRHRRKNSTKYGEMHGVDTCISGDFHLFGNRQGIKIDN